MNGIIDQNNVIQLRGVQQSFKVGEETIPALRQADFSIKANSFTIIFGASGSGKSTLLNVLAGLQPPTAGTVTIEGKNIYELKSDELAHFRANRVGFMHQTNHWIKSLNVIENIAVPLYFLGNSKAKAVKLAHIALDRVNMSSYAKKMPLMLSGGEQQRIGMARALANDPLFIIADEPTGNLDTENGDAIMNLLLNCQTEFRRTIILVTHNLEYISLADHLLRIQDGIVEDIPSSNTQTVMNVLLKDVQSRVKDLKEIKKHATNNS
jgi:putative ABC transport system ATP-binding protein